MNGPVDFCQNPLPFCGRKGRASASAHLLFVPHGALSSDHDLAACFRLQLLRRETSWSQNPAYEIILQREREIKY